MWFLSAKKRPIQGHTDGPMSGYKGIVLHVNQSNGNLFNWFNGDHNVSAHFEVYKDGTAEQYITTANTSWCQADGNAYYLSLETEGFVTEPLTDKQLHKCAEIVAEAHMVHGIPLQLAEHPGEHGLGWHGMGGTAWGGHTGCPGDIRKAQRSKILAIARAIVERETGMSPEDTEKMIMEALRALVLGGDHGPFTETKYPHVFRDANHGVYDMFNKLRSELQAEIKALQ